VCVCVCVFPSLISSISSSSPTMDFPFVLVLYYPSFNFLGPILPKQKQIEFSCSLLNIKF